PPAGGALAKAASGALEQVPLVRVVNLARALDRIKEAGFWVCGLAEDAAEPLAALDLGDRAALVLGSEGGGLRRLVRERCDRLARLPTRPLQPTLNVSNAAAVALYELVRRHA
ncbi:MAG TPA: RNA methyltransferase, partial [Stellaceae bacterium]|nr:RNA methyltransferase [Stellaceae bacterium]